jgi:replicative DNA helicase
VILVEAEMDCIASYQFGLKNVVSLTAGAQTFEPEWKLFFSRFEKVYIMLDNDAVGQTAARDISDKIGIQKCWNIRLPDPIKDMNEYLLSGATMQDFGQLVHGAKQFKIKELSTMSDLVGNLDDWLSGKDGTLKGISTGFEQLDKVTSGLKNGELIGVMGNHGTGKTTFLFNMVDKMLRDNKRILSFSLEGNMEFSLARMIGQHYDMKHTDLNKDETKWEEIKEETMKLPFYWYSGSQSGVNIKMLQEFLPTVVNLFDINVIIIDNLTNAITDDNNVTNKVKAFVTCLKNLAVDLHCVIILVVHPRKTEKAVEKLGLQDIRDSSVVGDLSSQVWILQKVAGSYYIDIPKNRYGASGVSIPLKVDMDIGKFEEMSEAESVISEVKKDDF